MSRTKERKPILGFIGLMLTLVACPIGIYMITSDLPVLICAGVIFMAIGPAILAYALFTGNIKLFG